MDVPAPAASNAVSKTLGPAETFINVVGGMVDQGDVKAIIAQQNLMLGRFEKTNAKLESFNSLEAGRFGVAMEQFRSHTRVLTDMKKDLDAVFRRIRLLRGKLARQYPDMFKAYELENAAEADVEDDEEDTAAGEGDGRTAVLPDNTLPADSDNNSPVATDIPS